MYVSEVGELGSYTMYIIDPWQHELLHVLVLPAFY